MLERCARAPVPTRRCVATRFRYDIIVCLYCNCSWPDIVAFCSVEFAYCSPTAHVCRFSLHYLCACRTFPTCVDVDSVDLVLRIAIDLAQALKHLHDNRVVHRDVAARNVLLSSNKPFSATAGVCLLLVFVFHLVVCMVRFVSADTRWPRSGQLACCAERFRAVAATGIHGR